MRNKPLLSKFLLGCLVGVITLILLSPIEFIAYKFFGPYGNPNSIQNKEPIENWGKGDYWTPYEPYLCSGKHAPYHCSQAEYRKQTLFLSIFVPVMIPFLPLAILAGEPSALAPLIYIICFATIWTILFGLLNLYTDVSVGILKRLGIENES